MRSGDGEPFADPFAYDADHEAELVRRAAAGTSHLLYARSPGGATATARRVARWRPQVEAAARQARMPADLVEGLVYLESAGRPDAMAGYIEGAVGLTQILAETGQHLLGMHVDVARSARLTQRIAGQSCAAAGTSSRAWRRGGAPSTSASTPPRRWPAPARYLDLRTRAAGPATTSRSRRTTWASGNLQAVIRLSGEDAPSYAQLYFDATPSRNPAVQKRLACSATTPRPTCSRSTRRREIMRLYRRDPSALARLEALHASKNSAEEVLHPPGDTPSFATPAALEAGVGRAAPSAASRAGPR